MKEILQIMLCLLVVASCSSNDGIEDETGGKANTRCAVTGEAHTISHCSAHIQASYHFPADVTLPENYDWREGASLGVCYGTGSDVANENSNRVSIAFDETLTDVSDINFYGGGYAYDNDTTYYNLLIDYCEPNTTYYYCTFFTYFGKTYYGEVKSFTTKPLSKSVDLGLSVNWAAWNVGATSPEQIGDYYAWGETETKSEATAVTESDISRTKYDVAHKKWGEPWRMPTKTEIEELISKCTWIYTKCREQKGYLLTGSNDNTLFLPLPLYSSGYWSSSSADKYVHAGTYDWVYFLDCDDLTFSLGSKIKPSIKSRYSSGNCCVRPVCD